MNPITDWLGSHPALCLLCGINQEFPCSFCPPLELEALPWVVSQILRVPPKSYSVWVLHLLNPRSRSEFRGIGQKISIVFLRTSGFGVHLLYSLNRECMKSESSSLIGIPSPKCYYLLITLKNATFITPECAASMGCRMS